MKCWASSARWGAKTRSRPPRAPRRHHGAAATSGPGQLVVERVPDQRVARSEARPGDPARRPTIRSAIASSSGSSMSSSRKLAEPGTRASSPNSRPITEAGRAGSRQRLGEPRRRRPITARTPAGIGGRRRLGDPAVGIEEAHDLRNEERVAFGLGVDRLDQSRCGLDPGRRLDVLANVAPRSAGQRDLGGRGSRTTSASAEVERVAQRRVDVAVRANHEQPAVGDLASDEPEQQERRLVRGVRSSSTSTIGWACAALRRKALAASKSRKRAPSDSSAGVREPRKSSRSSGRS